MPGVAGSSGSGVRAGARGGVCVLCASACLYRKEPTYSFRFQTSLISPAVPATLGRGSFRRRPTVLPSSPPAQGSPPRHRAHRPPHGRCRGPGSARRAGTLSQRWVLCPYSLAHGRGKERIKGDGERASRAGAKGMAMLEGFVLGWGSQPVGLCWRTATEPFTGQGLVGRVARERSAGRRHGRGICTVPVGEQRVPPGTGTDMARGKARLCSPRS